VGRAGASTVNSATRRSALLLDAYSGNADVHAGVTAFVLGAARASGSDGSNGRTDSSAVPCHPELAVRALVLASIASPPFTRRICASSSTLPVWMLAASIVSSIAGSAFQVEPRLVLLEVALHSHKTLEKPDAELDSQAARVNQPATDESLSDR
jgi:hypothetical protein